MYLLLNFLFLTLILVLGLCLFLAGALALSVHWIERSLAQGMRAPVLTKAPSATSNQLQGDPLWGVPERFEPLPTLATS